MPGTITNEARTLSDVEIVAAQALAYSGDDLPGFFADWRGRMREALRLSGALPMREGVIYDADKKQVYSFLQMHPDGSGLVCAYSGDTVAQVRASYPGRVFEVMEYAQAADLIQAHDAARFAPVHLISAEEYQEKLEVLPPMGWVGHCFTMSEMTTGSWSACYTRAPDGQYLSGMRDCARETPRQAHDRLCAAYVAGDATPAPSMEAGE